MWGRCRGGAGEIWGDLGEVRARYDLLRVAEHAGVVGLVALHVGQRDHERAWSGLGLGLALGLGLGLGLGLE